MGGVHETQVCLRFSGEDLQPEHVSLALRCEPDLSAVKGGRPKMSRGTGFVARTGLWNKGVARRVPGDLDSQIAELLGLMTDDLDVWRRLTTQFKSDVFCGLFMEEWNQGLSISPETLFALGARGLELGLDIYGPGQPQTDGETPPPAPAPP